MLIASPRHTREDLALWATHERADHLLARRLHSKVQRAIDTIRTFAAEPCYAGVSWGKDSVVLAHLVQRACVAVPLVWVRVEPICNPECAAVRDAYLARYPADYREIESWCRWGDDGEWHASGTLEDGFHQANCGTRYLSGVRGDESSGRAKRMRAYGESTANTCAPIGWWSTAEVFAYLTAHDLPVHPAYGYLGGGLYRRDRLRVASLGGRRGDGWGRTEWERWYYGDRLREVEALGRARDRASYAAIGREVVGPPGLAR